MDVCVLRWPDQADEAHRLASLGTPRLLLVEPGVPPPTETSCVADWLRLPVEDQDMRARLAALSERSLRHPIAPVVDDCGGVSYRGTTVFLPEVDERIARILIESFGRPVRNEELISRVWTEDASKGALRVHVFRLRHRLAPLGLTITSIRGHGYVMREAEATDTAAIAERITSYLRRPRTPLSRRLTDSAGLAMRPP